MLCGLHLGKTALEFVPGMVPLVKGRDSGVPSKGRIQHSTLGLSFSILPLIAV